MSESEIVSIEQSTINKLHNRIWERDRLIILMGEQALRERLVQLIDMELQEEKLIGVSKTTEPVEKDTAYGCVKCHENFIVAEGECVSYDNATGMPICDVCARKVR